jgi:hypothetical protein
MTLKSRLGIAAAVAAAVASAGFAFAGDMVKREDGKTVVEAPTTHVTADERTGATQVKVRAPSTSVDVDTERGHVRIRVPYFSGDIRW